MSDARVRSRRLGVLVVSTVVSAGLLAALIWRVDILEFWRAVSAARLPPVAAALVLALLCNVLLSTGALAASLRAFDSSPSYRQCLSATLGHLALHALSFVVGKGARAAYLVRTAEVPFARAASAEALLFVAKLAALGVVVALGAMLRVRLAFGGAALLALIGLGYWARRQEARVSHVAASLALTLALTLGQVAVFALALRALGASVPLSELCLFFPVCLAGAKLPIFAFGIGTREALVVTLLAGTAPAPTLLAASVIFSAVEQVFPGLFGLLFAPRFVMRTLGQ